MSEERIDVVLKRTAWSISILVGLSTLLTSAIARHVKENFPSSPVTAKMLVHCLTAASFIGSVSGLSFAISAAAIQVHFGGKARLWPIAVLFFLSCVAIYELAYGIGYND